MNDKLIARMQAPGPKKILALDGGGIRGMITVEVLAEIETLLRQKLGRGDDFVLADYFDFVSGTSTGAIIAACISIGMKFRISARFISTVARRCSIKHLCLNDFATNSRTINSRPRCGRCSARMRPWAATG